MSDKQEIKVIPLGVSPVRQIMSEMHGNEFQPLASFDEARKTQDSVAVFEADFGGQIMMTVPMKYVKCSERQLELLLFDLHEILWNGHDEQGAGLYYERIPVGACITGGMGGGCVVDGVWAHSKFEKNGLDLGKFGQAIGAVLEGRAQRIAEGLQV